MSSYRGLLTPLPAHASRLGWSVNRGRFQAIGCADPRPLDTSNRTP